MVRVVLSSIVLACATATAVAQAPAATAEGAVPVPVQPAGLQSSAPARVAGPVRAAAEAAPAPSRATATNRRAEVRWSGETSSTPGSVNAAYVELEAARAASDEAEARLKAAVVPLPGESVRRADGTLRYLPAYYDRVAPFERDAMIAQERLERADLGLRSAR